MSGTPSWAFTAPSAYSTALWTIDCGWTRTSIRSAGTPKSQRASMTSKPLFIMVAESMVIFAPISHVGCRRASAAVSPSICERDSVRNGPPEAVSSMRVISLSWSPTMLWNMAECSESTGIIGEWHSCERRMIVSPATTRVSLLARHIFLWAFMARTVGRSPAKPTMAVRTMSTGSAQTISSRASLPA